MLARYGEQDQLKSSLRPGVATLQPPLSSSAPFEAESGGSV